MYFSLIKVLSILTNEMEFQGNISSLVLLGLFLVFVSYWKKKLAGDNERVSVLLQVLYSNHYNLLWGCYLYYWNMAFTEPRRLDSGKWGHIFCNPFICMDIKYVIPCIKWGGKKTFLIELKRKMRYFLSQNTLALCVITQ